MVALSVVVAGTIGSYGDLLNKVGLWLDRGDLDDRIPDFVALLEARLNRELRAVNMETRTTFTTGDASYDLPEGFRSLRKIFVDGSPQTPLKAISPANVAWQYNGEAGIPQAYFIENRTLTFRPVPASDTTFAMTYLTRLVPLTSENDSNWLLEEHPDIYLTGTLLEAAIYIRDEDAISFLAPSLDSKIASLQRESRLDRWGSGPLVPNGAVQTRGGLC